MKVFTYSQARQRFSAVLDTAMKEKVLITRRGGDRFCLSREISTESPFDVPGIRTEATTQDILRAVRESISAKPNKSLKLMVNRCSRAFRFAPRARRRTTR